LRASGTSRAASRSSTWGSAQLPSLLFEIGCEELPAAALDEAALQLPALVRAHVGASPSDLYLAPRRIAFFAPEVPERTPDEWVKGPPEHLRDKAAEGFARRHGVTVDELTVRDGFLGVELAGKGVRTVLPEALAAIVHGLTFAKSMRWPGVDFRFARPVRWLCAKLDEETIDVPLAGVPAGGVTYARRFEGERVVEVPHARAYVETLRAQGVDPDRATRMMDITAALDALGGWTDPGHVLDEVVYLVESPRVQDGRFDEKYLQLPTLVIVTTMQSHQRYFPLGGNRFAFAANGGEPETVRRGNERVLNGRLEDALFTFERDVAVGIDELAQRTVDITFFAGAGSYGDKAQRLVRLVEQLGGGDASREAARLAKADQAAELVREFPELEGYIGAEYARLAGYPEGVCAAIEEHYLPESAHGPLPQTEAGRILAAADRIDTLNVAFELGHQPTGSRDPFGLRRAAIGLCRLATEGGLRVLLSLLRDDVADFTEERFENLLDVPVEYVRAARRARADHLGRVAEIARTLAALDRAHLERIHTIFTRAQNITAKADGAAETLRPELLVEDAERRVAETLGEVSAQLESADAVEQQVHAADRLAEPLEQFFQDVLVMADDRDVRANRLRLLRDVRDTIEASLGDLSQIPL
jgi:glycyl-tRNA synthetase beta chain